MFVETSSKQYTNVCYPQLGKVSIQFMETMKHDHSRASNATKTSVELKVDVESQANDSNHKQTAQQGM